METAANKPLSEDQVERIEQKIISTKNKANDMAKRVLLYLIAKSKNFTRPVVITLTESTEFNADQISSIAEGFEKLLTSGPDDVNALLKIAGTDFLFSEHFGFMENGKLNTDNQFGFEKGVHKMAYTFWLSPKTYDKTAKIIPFQFE